MIPKLMNTYRLDPKKRFDPDTVYSILQEIVNKHCFGEKYDSVKSSSKTVTIAGEILQQVKKLNFDRYRIIVYVQLGENYQQGLESALKYLWDESRDAFTVYTLRGKEIFTTAICYGIYKD